MLILPQACWAQTGAGCAARPLRCLHTTYKSPHEDPQAVLPRAHALAAELMGKNSTGRTAPPRVRGSLPKTHSPTRLERLKASREMPPLPGPRTKDPGPGTRLPKQDHPGKQGTERLKLQSCTRVAVPAGYVLSAARRKELQSHLLSPASPGPSQSPLPVRCGEEDQNRHHHCRHAQATHQGHCRSCKSHAAL